MSQTTYSIAIVDDHLLIAKALSGMIENFDAYNVLYEVEHGKALTEKFKQPKNVPDIVLLDINMPIMDGFETAKWLRQYHPGVLVLALSMQDDEQALIQMIRNGAKGYLLKNVHPKELEKALDLVVKDGFYYPAWATKKLLTLVAEEDGGKPPTVKLNEREGEFLQYAATELAYHEIAKKMFCSTRTVESYRDALFEKFNVRTRVGLVINAIKTGLIKV